MNKILFISPLHGTIVYIKNITILYFLCTVLNWDIGHNKTTYPNHKKQKTFFKGGEKF